LCQLQMECYISFLGLGVYLMLWYCVALGRGTFILLSTNFRLTSLCVHYVYCSIFIDSYLKRSDLDIHLNNFSKNSSKKIFELSLMNIIIIFI
ncbi:hypothetical protein L9F63_007667, partial [Diploptera punctata]